MLLPKKNLGFSLIELLVAIAILAVMASIALSSHQSSIIKSKRKAALGALFQITSEQEEHFINNKGYAASLILLGYTTTGENTDPFYINDNGDPSTNAQGNYQITLNNASANAYSLTATPINSQSKDNQCGALTVTSAGAKSISGTADINICFR